MKHQSNFKLGSEIVCAIDRLAKSLGLSKTEVVEEAIRQLQREIDGDVGTSPAEGLNVPPEPVQAARLVSVHVFEPPPPSEKLFVGSGSKLVFGDLLKK